MRGRRELLIGLAAVLLVILLTGGAVTSFYAEYHWFRSLGFESRFWKLELMRWGVGGGLFLVATAAVLGVLWPTVGRGGPVQIRRQLGDLEIAEALPVRWVRWVLVGAAVMAGFLVAVPFADPLAQALLFIVHSAPWGDPEPILGRDPRFYVFVLPFLRTLWSVLVAILTWVSIGLGAFLFLAGRIRASGEGVTVDPFARRRLAYLGAAVLLLVAGHFALSWFELVSGGAVGYAEALGEIPGRRLVAILAGVAAVAVIYAGRVGNWSPALSALAVLAVAWPAGALVYPEILQRFRVEPNEFEVERPYIEANVAATRQAFGLADIRSLPYEVTATPPERSTIERWTASLPLWDERPLHSTYNQLQGLLAFHEFPRVAMDRYGPEGDRQQVGIAIREFAPGRLATQARTWQNLHLRYTHGSGVVATAVDRATEGGEPEYYLSGLPPRRDPTAPEAMEIREPRVFFGELTTEYVIRPSGAVPGIGAPTGVELDGLLRRATFAWALGSKNILLRDPGSGGRVLMWRRQVISRVQALVPFLVVDPEPYPVIHDGRVKWIVELYSTSRRYPLSAPADLQGQNVNYLRSAAKGVVDGVTGEVDLYLPDPEEPLVATYRRAFPDLFRSLESMPPDLRAHIRYPPAVFRTQAAVLETYHMIEPEIFYQKQDLWSVGREVVEQRAVPMEPYYLLMPLPAPQEEGEGQGRQEFLLTLPYTPHDRDNLASFLMARNDGEQYGELWLFDLTAERQVFGPRQVEVQIDQDPIISQQLSLWQQQGSRAIRGHLLLVPIEGFLLYVEPLFLVAEDAEGAAPGLKRVIASAGDRVAMGETLPDALARLLGEAPRIAPAEELLEEGDPAVAAAGDEEAAGEPEPAAPEVSPPAPGSLRDLLEEADRALREGDLARFGELWSRIRDAAGEGEESPTNPSGG